MPQDLLMSVVSYSVRGAQAVGFRRAQEHFGPRFEVNLVDQTVIREGQRDGRTTYRVKMTFRARRRAAERKLPTGFWGRLRLALVSR